MIRPITAMLCLAAASVHAAPPALTASPAPGLDLEQAWSDRAGWGGAEPVLLRGADGSDAPTAELRARWNDSAVFFEFLCRDASLVSPGKRDGMDHFKLGDVVEIFLGRRDQPGYFEIHATPAGRKTVYAFRGYREKSAPRPGSDVRAGKTAGGWRAVLSIPWQVAGGRPDEGGWEFLAGRYDYDRAGGLAVLSSFPAQHGKPDFHKREGFARLLLQE